ncbi:MAG TPA: DNA-binding protein [Thermoanaerobaculia bacterium]|nr:DNA-binding protein [Thermoanaerobaculia bacterium]HQN08692.1 DNA-binding protein [Thermoanaerobaculia bacterium]HQP85075.1 DNA-binding protein [Thermoanaerobaculia bacterium]
MAIPRTRERFDQKLMARLRDAAASVGVSEAALRSEIRLGRLEARRMGRAVLIPVDELRRWAADLPPAA